MPGLFTTTSQERRASIPPAPVARISRPSSDAAPGASSTSTGSRPMDRSRRMLACPSTPSPQTPTDASASADQEIGWRITIRDVMGAARLQQRAGIGRCGVAQFGPQSGQELCSGAVLAPRGEDEGAPAFVDVPHAFERLGADAQAQQCPETLLVGRVLQRFVAGEDRFELAALHEGRQDEVDEAALVAATAPVVQPFCRVLVKGAVAAPKRAVVGGQPGELLRDPELGARAQDGEDRKVRTEGGPD